MTPEKALELASQYGILNVVLILNLFFEGGLIIYILRQSREREIERSQEKKESDERWSVVFAKHLESIEAQTAERHIANQVSMSRLSTADDYQRVEHKSLTEGQNKILNALEKTIDLLGGEICKIAKNLKT